MTPLVDSSRRPARFPAVTVAPIAINVAAFGLEPLGGDDFVFAWSATPAEIAASTIPNVGASGAVAAVMGAFLIRYPHDRIKTLVPIGPFLTLLSIPASLLIGLWLLIQMLNEVGSLVDMQSGGVAYVAHIAGALYGATSGGLFSKPHLQVGGPPWEPTT